MSAIYKKLNTLVQAKIGKECVSLMLKKGVSESVIVSSDKSELQKLFEEYLTKEEIDEIIDNVQSELLEMSTHVKLI